MSETVQNMTKVYKQESHQVFQLVPKLLTLYNLEWFIAVDCSLKDDQVCY